MFRRRTVEALMRQSMREKEQLLAIVKEQAEQLMFLAGRQYAPTPLDDANLERERELEREQDDEDELVDVGQEPGNLGFDPY